MKIVILGAGQVGSTLAERLSFEKNDITLVDASKRRLKQLPDLDVRTVSATPRVPLPCAKQG